jgi:hypothetical protein
MQISGAMVPPPPLPAGQFLPGRPTNGDRGQGNVQPEVHRTSTPTNNNGSRFQSVRSTLARPFHFVAALNPVLYPDLFCNEHEDMEFFLNIPNRPFEFRILFLC